MAIAKIDSAIGQGNASTDATAGPINSSGANFMCACGDYINTASLTPDVDSKGNSYTSAAYSDDGVIEKSQIWYCENAIVGSGHTGTLGDGTATYPALWLGAFSGVATASSLDKISGNGSPVGVTSLSSGNVVPGESDELIISCNDVGDTSTPTCDLASTDLGVPIVNAVAFGLYVAFEIQAPGPTTRNPTWTWAVPNRAVTATATFKKSAASSVVFRRLTLLGVGA